MGQYGEVEGSQGQRTALVIDSGAYVYAGAWERVLGEGGLQASVSER